MALQRLPGTGLNIPGYPALDYYTIGDSAIIDAAGEKLAFSGRVWFNGTGNKSIRYVQWLFGAVTKTGGSTLTVSLQDVNLAAGPQLQPDETQDESATIANADASFATNTWIRSPQLSADRVVANGTLLSVVIEFLSFQAGDSIRVRGKTNPGTSLMVPLLSCVSAKIGTPAWGTTLPGGCSSLWPNVVLEFTDGTFGTFEGAFVCSNISSVAFKQDTGTADEYGMQFSFPGPVEVDSLLAWVNMSGSSTNNFQMVLTAGSEVSATVDANAVREATQGLSVAPIEKTALAKDTTYYVSIRPNQTAANISLYYFDVADNGHFQCHAGGVNWLMVARLNGGAWSNYGSNLRRPYMGLRVCSIDDGVSAGGGFPILGGSVVR